MAHLRDVYGDPVRQTDEYGNPVHHPGTMGSYDTGATGFIQTDEYGNPVQHSGTKGSYDTGAGRHREDPLLSGDRHDPGFGTGTGYGGVRTYDTGTGIGGHGTGHGVTGTGYSGGGSYDTGTDMGGYGTGHGAAGTGYGGGGSYDTGTGIGGVDQPPLQNQYGGVTVPTTAGVTQLQRSGSSSSSSSEDDGQGGRRKKKGLKEKIKEKLPGGRGRRKDEYGTGTGTGYEATTATGLDPHGRYAGTEQHEKKGIIEKIKEKLPGGHH